MEEERRKLRESELKRVENEEQEGEEDGKKMKNSSGDGEAEI